MGLLANVKIDTLLYKQVFATSGYSADSVKVVTFQFTDQQGRVGIGEASPRAYVNQSAEQAHEQLLVVQQLLAAGADLRVVENFLAVCGGSARFAYDTAEHQLLAQRQNKSFAQTYGIEDNVLGQPVTTAYTLSLDTPEAMAKQAKEAIHTNGFNIIKMKIDADVAANLERLKAVYDVSQNIQFYLDANQAFDNHSNFASFTQAIANYPISLIEQPFKPNSEAEQTMERGQFGPIPIVADESLLGPENLGYLAARYDAGNIKLDKCGGLTAGLELAKALRENGMDVMVGCMGASSLSIMPGVVLALAAKAKYVDLDGAFLTKDDPYKLVGYSNGKVWIPKP